MSAPTSVAVLTMVRNEPVWLPRWLAYYGGQVGVQNLVVFDDQSTDGSTDGLPCPVHRLPKDWTRGVGFDRRRTQLMNGVAGGLLHAYEVVIYTDVDEFLVPDPARHGGLVDYLAARPLEKVLGPVGLNVVQHGRVEGPLRPGLPVTEQRSFVKFCGAMCKPAIKRIPARWWAAGHGIKAPYAVDPELLMLHLKYADREELTRTAGHRHGRFRVDGDGAGSTWSVSAERLLRQLEQHVDTVDPSEAADYEPAGRDYSGCVRPSEDGREHRAAGSQLHSLARQPLARLPARFVGLV